MKRSVAFACFLALLFSLCGCSLFRTDREKIEERIDAFVSAYNSGDSEKVLDCLDSKTRNTFKSSMALTEALTGMGGFKISDLFSVGVGINKDDVLKVNIVDVEIDEESATVEVILSYKDSKSQLKDVEAYFTMVKEKRNWYIKNLEDK